MENKHITIFHGPQHPGITGNMSVEDELSFRLLRSYVVSVCLSQTRMKPILPWLLKSWPDLKSLPGHSILE